MSSLITKKLDITSPIQVLREQNTLPDIYPTKRGAGDKQGII